MSNHCLLIWWGTEQRWQCSILTFSWWMMSMRLLRVSLKWIWILTGNSPQPRRVKWKGGSLRTHRHQTQSEFFMWSKQPERQKHSHVHKKNSLHLFEIWPEFIRSGNQSVKVTSSFFSLWSQSFWSPHHTHWQAAFRGAPLHAYTSCISLSAPHQAGATAHIDVLPLQKSAFVHCQECQWGGLLRDEKSVSQKGLQAKAGSQLKQPGGYSSGWKVLSDLRDNIFKAICETQILCHPWRI